MKMLGIVTVGVVRAPICRVHCAVIFAIAQLSCYCSCDQSLRSADIYFVTASRVFRNPKRRRTQMYISDAHFQKCSNFSIFFTFFTAASLGSLLIKNYY